jgi:hypothetical protein
MRWPRCWPVRRSRKTRGERAIRTDGAVNTIVKGAQILRRLRFPLGHRNAVQRTSSAALRLPVANRRRSALPPCEEHVAQPGAVVRSVDWQAKTVEHRGLLVREFDRDVLELDRRIDELGDIRRISDELAIRFDRRVARPQSRRSDASPREFPVETAAKSRSSATSLPVCHGSARDERHGDRGFGAFGSLI